MAIRPRTLTAAVAPVLVGIGAALGAGYDLRWDAAAAALLGALLIQVATNLANDLGDFRRGADLGDRLGPPRAVSAGWITPRAALIGIGLTLALAVLVGLYLERIAGPTVIAIGVFSILAGIAYTAGPFPLAYNGLGDLFVLLFFGLVAVAGTSYVVAGRVPISAWYGAASVGSLATALLTINNLRDAPQDRLSRKRTLAVLFGTRFALGQYAVLLLVPYAMPLLLLWQRRSTAWVLLPLVTAPLAISLWRRARIAEGREFNRVLAATAKLLLLHSLLLSVGLIFR